MKRNTLTCFCLVDESYNKLKKVKCDTVTVIFGIEGVYVTCLSFVGLLQGL